MKCIEGRTMRAVAIKPTGELCIDASQPDNVFCSTVHRMRISAHS